MGEEDNDEKPCCSTRKLATKTLKPHESTDETCFKPVMAIRLITPTTNDEATYPNRDVTNDFTMPRTIDWPSKLTLKEIQARHTPKEGFTKDHDGMIIDNIGRYWVPEGDDTQNFKLQLFVAAHQGAGRHHGTDSTVRTITERYIW